MAFVRMAGVVLLGGTLLAATPAPRATLFTDAERAAIVDFWTSKATYETSPAGSPGQEWSTRMTPGGSKWIREVYKLFQSGKVVPTIDPTGNDPQQQAWVAWIDRQVQRDWADSDRRAAALNAGTTEEKKPDPPVTVAHNDNFKRKAGTDEIRKEPQPEPVPVQDPCPPDLVAKVGAPPRFAAPVRPMRHTVSFGDGQSFTYVDNVKVRQKYAYYRFPDGVISGGESVKSLPEATLTSLMQAAGITGSEQKVMKAVSVLEGGFDSVNTYDTGYVSVGFIQFACLGEGAGSLGAMMQRYKDTNPAAFKQDFHRFGIDVEGGKLAVLDLESGEEKVGAEAAMQVIHDKRLVAAFQRAGRNSQSFRVAQLQAAKAQFYPANETVTVSLGGNDCTLRVCDVFKTEAGMATLMDRKVNTGKLAGLKEAIEKVAAQYGLTDPDSLCDIEFQVARMMTYRADYLAASALSKPRDNSALLSRKGSRVNRKSEGDPASAGGGSRHGSRKRG